MNQLRDRPLLASLTRITLTILLAGLLAASCAWINPHPRAPELYDFKYDSSPIIFAGNLPTAIDAAIAQRKLYASHASQMSILRSATAITVGAVTIPALYLGIHAEGPDAVTALGLAGASALGLASYFDSRPRQRLYYAASRTIGCAYGAMLPFLIPETDFKTFTAALTQLGVDAAMVETLASTVESATASLTSPVKESQDFLAFAKAQTASARLLLERSKRIEDEGNKLKSLIDKAGNNLRNKVLEIVDKVDEEINKTESDPQSLVTMLGGLQSVGQQLTRVTPVGGGTGTGKVTPTAKAGIQSGTTNKDELIDKLENGLDDLQNHTNKMVQRTVPVAALINQVAAAKEQVQDIKSCQPPGLQTDFRVLLSKDTIDVQAPTTVDFAVIASVGPPNLAMSNQTGADIKKFETVVKGNTHQVVIEIGGNAKSVDLILEVSNGNGSELGRREITIRVKEAPKQPPESPGAKPLVTGLKKDEVKLSQEQIKVLQSIVGLRVTDDTTFKDRADGLDGPLTRDAVRKFKVDNGLGSDSTIDSEFFKFVDASSKQPLPNPSSDGDLKRITGAVNAFETQQLPPTSKSKDLVKTEALKDLQRRLGGMGAKETGEYDADMRKAIIAFQISQNRRATGILGQLLVAAIKNVNAKSVGAVASPPGTTPDTAKAGDPEAAEKAFTSDDRAAVQRTLASDLKMAIKDDGNFKEDTRKAIKAYQNKEKHRETGFLTKDEFVELLKREPKK